MLPGKIELSSLSQFESARPFTLATPIDVNHDGKPDFITNNVESNDISILLAQ